MEPVFSFSGAFCEQESIGATNLIDTILPIEMKMRGELQIEVWHWDGTTCSDLLGSLEFDLSQVTR